jgi:hypothetical protein
MRIKEYSRKVFKQDKIELVSLERLMESNRPKESLEALIS